MNKELISLRSKSFEAEVILKNFATRKRVHKDKEIQVHRLYLDFIRRGVKLNRMKFDQVFIDLERLGYGITIGKDVKGNVTAFLPDTSIKSIGMDAMEVLKPETTITVLPNPGAPTIKLAAIEPKPIAIGLVRVIMIKDGMRWEADVPEDKIAEVTAKLA